jgi:hypothetical protein
MKIKVYVDDEVLMADIPDAVIKEIHTKAAEKHPHLQGDERMFKRWVAVYILDAHTKLLNEWTGQG